MGWIEHIHLPLFPKQLNRQEREREKKKVAQSYKDKEEDRRQETTA